MPIVDKLLTATIKFLQKKQKQLKKKRKAKRVASRRPKAKKRKTAKRKPVKKKLSKKPKKKPVKKTKKPTKKKKTVAKKKKKTVKKRKVVKKSKPKKKASKSSAKLKEKPEGILIGEVTHYFSKIKVVVLKMKKDKLVVGDLIMIKGRGHEFKQRVDSLQIESVDVKSAKKGQLVGLRVKSKAKEGDQVYRLS